MVLKGPWQHKMIYESQNMTTVLSLLFCYLHQRVLQEKEEQINVFNNSNTAVYILTRIWSVKVTAVITSSLHLSVVPENIHIQISFILSLKTFWLMPHTPGKLWFSFFHFSFWTRNCLDPEVVSTKWTDKWCLWTVAFSCVTGTLSTASTVGRSWAGMGWWNTWGHGGRS